MQAIRTITLISLVIFCYYLTYYLYSGITNPIPAPGDSWDYHIPIALSILDGNFLTLTKDYISGWYYPGTETTLTKIPQWYYPGSSEIFLGFFILSGIPMTLSNILPMLFLFFVCYKLARIFDLNQYLALLFAITLLSLNAVLRWANAISIDMWIAVWFVLSIILLEHPKKTLSYFAKLGFVLGMFIGSKYTALYFVFILLIFYIKKLIPYLTLSRFLVFLAPLSFFGLFWYIRNYLVTQNPFYPLPFFGFPGKNLFGEYTLINALLTHPIEFFNAAFGEYKIWLFSILLSMWYLIYTFVIKKQFPGNSLTKLFFLGTANFFLFLTFPTSEQSWIMVSSFRYSLPVFIPLILGVFLLASKYKKEELLGYFVIANMLPVLSMVYYPKLVIFYFPITLFIICFINKKLPIIKGKTASAKV